MADPAFLSNADSSYSIVLNDDSPMVTYTPFADTFTVPNTTGGWNPYYSGSGFAADPNKGEYGVGTSLHVTAADGASVAIQWNGTGISLYGTLMVAPASNVSASSVTYSVYLDGTPTTNYASSLSTPPNVATDILASFTNLTYGEHLVALTLHNPQAANHNATLLEFDRAVVVSQVPNVTSLAEASSSSTPPISFSVSTQPLPDNSISYQGQWSFQTDLLPGQAVPFHTSTNIGDRAHVSFNGTAVTLSGLTTPSSGSYQILMDDEAPVTLSARSSFNASSPTALYSRTGLDPTKLHELVVVNAGLENGGTGTLLISGDVNVTTVEGSTVTASASSASSQLSRGAVAAIAIGCAIAFLVLSGLLFLYLRWRRHSASRKRQFLVNPRTRRLSRLSFMGKKSSNAPHSVAEKHEDPELAIGHRPTTPISGVVDISAPKEEECVNSDDGTMEEVTFRIPWSDKGKNRENAHARQGSDGSFSIDLPALPPNVAHRDSGNVIVTSPRRYTVADSSSPRSPKPRGPRGMRNSDSHGSKGILLSPIQAADARAGAAGGWPRAGEAPLLPTEEGYLLPPAPGTPFRVNFEDEPPEQSAQRREGRHVSSGAMSLPQSLRQALSRVPGPRAMPEVAATVNEAEPRAAAHYSFLDFNSSRSTSVSGGSRSARQSRTNSTRSSSKSRRNNGSEHSAPSTNFATLPPERRISLGLSMTVGAGSSSNRAPNVSLQPVALPAEHSPSDPDASAQSGRQRDGSDILPSPTDSIPLTVSDIHFRHSAQSMASQMSESPHNANRASGSHRGPHPPLPQRPLIVQKLLGIATDSSGPVTPYSSPITPGFGTSASGTARPGPSTLSPATPSFGIFQRPR